jgi:hypothetical protein
MLASAVIATGNALQGDNPIIPRMMESHSNAIDITGYSSGSLHGINPRKGLAD